MRDKSVCSRDKMKQVQLSYKFTFQKLYKKDFIDHSETSQANILRNVHWKEVVTVMTTNFKGKQGESVLDCPTTFTKWIWGLYKHV